MTYSTNNYHKPKAKILKEALARFLSIVVSGGIFFWLYSQLGSDDYSFVPLIATIVGFYVVLEIVTTAWNYFTEQDELTMYSSDEIDQKLFQTMKQLSETIERKNSELQNGNLDEEKSIVKC